MGFLKFSTNPYKYKYLSTYIGLYISNLSSGLYNIFVHTPNTLIYDSFFIKDLSSRSHPSRYNFARRDLSRKLSDFSFRQ